LLPGLTGAHRIDVFVDGRPDRFEPPDAGVRLFSAHDFVWKHFQQPYDLTVYQLGNAPCHDYMWAYFVRYPGLVVLHDGQLHHARGRRLFEQRRYEDYRDEFAFNDPGTHPDLAELGIAGLLGSLTYLWPMRRVVVESSRSVVVHNDWLADQIRGESPGARVNVVDMGVPAPQASSGARQQIRDRHGIAADSVVFAAFGTVTPEKRIRQAIRAVAALAPTIPGAHLLLVGETVDHYDAREEALAAGVADRVTIAGFVPHEEVDAYLAAADVCLAMRWPTSRETSAAWLRCLAAGKPTIETDLQHMVDVPAFDPRDWSVVHAPRTPEDDGGEPAPVDPVCVSIDIMDEDHSLRLAMRRLATDAGLRSVLSRAARDLWETRFTLERMMSGYLTAIDAACAAPLPDAATREGLPRHFFADGTAGATELLREMGVPESRIARIWD
jgi:glycosyltransferase involved in cell wall biosynthesis